MRIKDRAFLFMMILTCVLYQRAKSERQDALKGLEDQKISSSATSAQVQAQMGPRRDINKVQDLKYAAQGSGDFDFAESYSQYSQESRQKTDKSQINLFSGKGISSFLNPVLSSHQIIH